MGSPITLHRSSFCKRAGLALASVILTSTHPCVLGHARGAGQHTMRERTVCADNTALVEELRRRGVIQSEKVERGMMAVDRGNFASIPQMAYMDAPSPIGHGATISAPHMHAYCLEALSPWLTPGAKVLDVGSGSGYLAAVMATLVQDRGSKAPGLVIGVEYIPTLVEAALQSAERDPTSRPLLDAGILQLRVGDGWQGWPESAPYDAIHVGAAAATVPQALVRQLAPGGRLVLPVGLDGQEQVLTVVDKDYTGHVKTKGLFSVQYVPLVHRNEA
uniref:Protein-L-isoaspartate O-methyltransferase n=1 Tax=Auxenochlorella protothecoides TaxID=3075 RepID=A0A1D2AC10_AUXPR